MSNISCFLLDVKVRTLNNDELMMMMIDIYFENVPFFHSKLGADVCPRRDNQPSRSHYTRPQSLVDHSTSRTRWLSNQCSNWVGGVEPPHLNLQNLLFLS